MKQILLLFFCAFSIQLTAPATGTYHDGDPQKVTLKVTGMTCGGCASHISKALQGVEGVLEDEVKFPGDVAMVTYDADKTNIEKIITAIEESGQYEAEVLKDEIDDDSMDKAMIDEDISFYQTNLVCGAASGIGCGTRAKPMLAAFMDHPKVGEAWLNHPGTVIAVVWKDNVVETQGVANQVFGQWDQSFLTLSGEMEAQHLADFENGKWYKGDDVDQLSIIEAGRIADQLTSWLDAEIDITEEKREQLHAAFKGYVIKEFMAIEDANVIYETSYWKRWEKELTVIGQKYLGDAMPAVQIVSGSSQQECKTEKSCCTKEGQKDCCKKEGTQ